MSDISVPQRKCRTCGESKPLDPEYWHKHKLCPDGLETQCKICKEEARRKRNKVSRPPKTCSAKKTSPKTKASVSRAKAYWRARVKELPRSLTKQQRRAAHIYFDNFCAICGDELAAQNVKLTKMLDHWIPVSDLRPDNPGTVPTNMIPMCRKCNSSKRNRDAIEWVKWKFEEPEASMVLLRVEEYFTRVRG